MKKGKSIKQAYFVALLGNKKDELKHKDERKTPKISIHKKCSFTRKRYLTN